METLTFEMLPGEYWWGGCVVGAENMPFDAQTEFTIDLHMQRKTQSAPLFLSSRGRFVWSEDPCQMTFEKGKITAVGRHLILNEEGRCLRDAYLNAMRRYFPFERDIYTPREFYRHPMFNTWMELIKNQNSRDILRYAHEVIDHGFAPGILIIDGGWQKCQGVWDYNRELIPDPKALFGELHELGFIVLIWCSPFMCSEGDNFLKLYASRSSEAMSGKPNYNHLVRNEQGEVSIQHWWSGFGAILNFNLPDDCAYMAEQLQRLMDDGVDGFKFDGGTYLPSSFLNGESFLGGYTPEQLNNAWIRFGSQYKYHEFKDTWKTGGWPVIQRLWDKKHAWTENGLNCLIPHGIFVGLIGNPFICPDMVGGGEWTSIVYGTLDEELYIRMAQASALFPMMQFSCLPWRHLSDRAVRAAKEMAELHERMWPEIERALEISEKTGEPIVRSLDYQFPGCGYETVKDQFLLGDRIMAAPVVTKGTDSRLVRFPSGLWEDEQGKRYQGPAEQMVSAPLDTLPWYRLIS